MHHQISICLFCLFGVTLNVQAISITGKVTNKQGKPIPNAVVSLVQQGLKDTTGADGNYSLIKDSVAVIPRIIPQSEKITFKRGVLEFQIINSSTANVEFFDLNGSLLKKVSFQNTLPGVHRMNIKDYFHAANMMVIRASIGQHVGFFRYLPLQKGKYALAQQVNYSKLINNKLAITIATIDTIKAIAEGYKEKKIPIATYDTIADITLDTISEAVCEGCGKTDYPKSGKASINVDGATREYILKLPDNYDPNKSYKLIFCFHAWGGNMDQIAQGGYYGLERLANKTAIFVSPQGLEDNGQPRGWSNPNGRDIKFVKAMLDYFNSSLCIDQKRIFSTGFSYGGMMSFAIGCAMGNVFRAIAPMSGAFYSGCDKSQDDPIAMWMAHGKSDDVVPLSDGKTALKHFIDKNGCSNETVPVEPSPCVAYQGCKDGFPVIYCEFNGGHSPQNWAQAATWAFFNQF